MVCNIGIVDIGHIIFDCIGDIDNIEMILYAILGTSKFNTQYIYTNITYVEEGLVEPNS